jgi:ATP-dependent protease ClpP protease subunit
MTIRKVPAIPQFAARSGFGFEVVPSALARFDGEIRAADSTTDNNVITILGTIGQDFFGDGITARRVAGALRAIGDQKVTVQVNSPGGDVFEALAIYNLLREHKQEVTVKVLGLAASAASVVAMAGDRIEVPRAGFLMIHNVWAIAVGNRHDMRDMADTLEPMDAALADLYSARSGLDAKDVGKMMDRETWIGGSEAVDKGFADALLPADQVKKAAQASLDGGYSATLNRVEILLAKGGATRAERRRLINDLKSGTPGAADDATQDAGATTEMAGVLQALGRIEIR